MLEKIMTQNLLKYAAGRQIFCQTCRTVLDWRETVLLERQNGSTAAIVCSSCYDAAAAAWGTDHPYKVIRHNTPKPRRIETPCPQKPGAALRNWLRKAIFAGHKLADKDRIVKADRVFPRGFGCRGDQWPMIETTVDDGTVTIDYGGAPVATAQQVADYVREYCRLNHIKVT